MKNCIIEHPEWQTAKRKYLVGLLTLGFWMLWFYLWAPLLSLAAWVLGYNAFEYHMIELKGYRGLFDLLATYAVLIGLFGGSLIVWASYNIRRFRGVDRRSPRPLIPLDKQAHHLKISADKLEQLQDSQSILIEHGHFHGSKITTPQPNSATGAD